MQIIWICKSSVHIDSLCRDNCLIYMIRSKHPVCLITYQCKGSFSWLSSGRENLPILRPKKLYDNLHRVCKHGKILLSLFEKCLCNIHCCRTCIKHDAVPIFDLFTHQFRNMLFTNNIAILSDVERKLDIHIFINYGTTIAFYGETVLNQFIEIPSDCFLRDLINLA